MPIKGYSQPNINSEIYDALKIRRSAQIKEPLSRYIERAIIEKLLRDEYINIEEIIKLLESAGLENLYLYHGNKNAEKK